MGVFVIFKISPFPSFPKRGYRRKVFSKEGKKNIHRKV
jgi:hypothetical protein